MSAKELWISTMHLSGISQDKWQQHWERLEQLYASPGRFYHSMQHIDKMAESLRRFSPVADLATRFAILYHDAIYDTTQTDNEEKSANLASESIKSLGIEQSTPELASQLILCTKKHQILESNIEKSAVFLDLDLLILGASPSDYDSYSAKIRKEYAWVPEAQYRSGREQVLHSFSKREFIYFTKEIRSLYETTARANIQRELDHLQSGKKI